MDKEINDFALAINVHDDAWHILLIGVIIVTFVTGVVAGGAYSRKLSRITFSIACAGAIALFTWIGVSIHATAQLHNASEVIADSVRETYGVALEYSSSDPDDTAAAVVDAVVNDLEDKPSVNVTLEDGEVRSFLVSFDNETGEATLYNKATLEELAAQDMR